MVKKAVTRTSLDAKIIEQKLRSFDASSSDGDSSSAAKRLDFMKSLSNLSSDGSMFLSSSQEEEFFISPVVSKTNVGGDWDVQTMKKHILPLRGGPTSTADSKPSINHGGENHTEKDGRKSSHQSSNIEKNGGSGGRRRRSSVSRCDLYGSQAAARSSTGSQQKTSATNTTTSVSRHLSEAENQAIKIKIPSKAYKEAGGLSQSDHGVRNTSRGKLPYSTNHRQGYHHLRKRDESKNGAGLRKKIQDELRPHSDHGVSTYTIRTDPAASHDKPKGEAESHLFHSPGKRTSRRRSRLSTNDRGTGSRERRRSDGGSNRSSRRERRSSSWGPKTEKGKKTDVETSINSPCTGTGRATSKSNTGLTGRRVHSWGNMVAEQSKGRERQTGNARFGRIKPRDGAAETDLLVNSEHLRRSASIDAGNRGPAKGDKLRAMASSDHDRYQRPRSVSSLHNLTDEKQKTYTRRTTTPFRSPARLRRSTSSSHNEKFTVATPVQAQLSRAERRKSISRHVRGEKKLHSPGIVSPGAAGPSHQEKKSERIKGLESFYGPAGYLGSNIK